MSITLLACEMSAIVFIMLIVTKKKKKPVFLVLFVLCVNFGEKIQIGMRAHTHTHTHAHTHTHTSKNTHNPTTQRQLTLGIFPY